MPDELGKVTPPPAPTTPTLCQIVRDPGIISRQIWIQIPSQI